MRLKEVGETCTIEYHDLANRWCYEINQYINIDNNDRKVIEDVIRQMYDDYLSFRMRWTRTTWNCHAEKYVTKLGDLVFKHPNPEKMVCDAVDNITDHLEAVLELPTWRVVHATFRNGYVKLELGEDYRIEDWTKRHGAKYGE